MLEINAVNAIQTPYLVQNKDEEKNVVGYNRPIYVNNPMRGLDTVGIYNAAMLVKKFPADKEPLPLIYNPDNGIDSIQGERILSSDGKLVAIIAKDDNTETYYTIKDGDVNKISVKDIKTGKDVQSQSIYRLTNEENGEKITNITVRKYDLTGKGFNKSTDYEGGIVVNNNINKDIAKDRWLDVYYTPANKNEKERESIYINVPNGYTTIDVNDKQQITNIYSNVEKDNAEYTKETNFYNGIPVSESVSVCKERTIPNMAGLEFVNNPELQPAEKYVIDENAKSNDGEKTYYSNGAIEKNTLPNGVTYYYNPKGEVEKIIDGNKTITIKEGKQIIEEDLGNSTTKTTNFSWESFCVVELKNKDTYKMLETYKNLPSTYEERSIDAEGNEKTTTYLRFNEKGMLESTSEY